MVDPWTAGFARRVSSSAPSRSGRLDHFHHQDGRLLCEDVPPSAIAEAVGTPVYVYSKRTVRDQDQMNT